MKLALLDYKDEMLTQQVDEFLPAVLAKLEKRLPRIASREKALQEVRAALIEVEREFRMESRRL